MVKKILKWICYVFIILVIGLLLWRIFYAESKNVMSDVTPTDAAISAYKAGEEFLTHRTVQIGGISNDGFMRCYAFVYIPSQGEMQVTVKTNESIYGSIPNIKGFSFKLYDPATKEEWQASSVETLKKGVYMYFRPVFDGVTFDESSDDELEIVMTSEDGTEDYSVFKLHDNTAEFKKYKLSSKEKASLGG